jgi:hypothetical protein
MTPRDKLHEFMDLKMLKAAFFLKQTEEDYDYANECEEVFLKGERPNLYFELNDFKKDEKLGLVYTNTLQM